MVNIKLQADALLSFGAMMKDLLAEEPWENEDIVKYMAIRMQEAADRWINPELPSQRPSSSAYLKKLRELQNKSENCSIVFSENYEN